MNRETTAALLKGIQAQVDLIPIMQAFVDGKKIQVRDAAEDSTWLDTPNPDWYPGKEYRVKPEPLAKFLIIECERNMSTGEVFTRRDAAEKALASKYQPRYYRVAEFVEKL